MANHTRKDKQTMIIDISRQKDDNKRGARRKIECEIFCGANKSFIIFVISGPFCRYLVGSRQNDEGEKTESIVISPRKDEIAQIGHHSIVTGALIFSKLSKV